MHAVRRGLPLWLALFAAYAATLAVDGRLTAPEAHRLLVAESIATDRDLDVADDARTGEVVALPDRGRNLAAPVLADGEPDAIVRLPTATLGHTLEPVGIGFASLAAPAYAAGDVVGAPAAAVRLWLAALTALGFVLAAALGRRLVPEPWATRAALVAGLSPPVLGAAAAISPEGVGATVLAGAALLALRVRDEPRAAWAFWCAALVGCAPWLSLKLLAPAAVIALALARWLRRRARGLTGFVALEVVLMSAVVYITVHERLYDGFNPYRDRPTGATGAADHLERAPRLLELWGDPGVGLLRWAPFALLAFVSLWLLWRSRRDRLAVALPAQVDVEVASAFLLLICGAVAIVAAFLAPGTSGPWFPGRELVPAAPAGAALAAWGLRFAPRTGAVLTVLTLGTSAYLLLAGLLGDLTLRPFHA
ncbi:MAG: hypothetical protein HZB46_02300 [Solirubrobacterales bacterium]|nr:hypothetical protein [Solirubrobacterales bacterium]